MGTDLQLTGLASGFDWAPVVDQLIELERIPQQRLEREKLGNEEKMSDLTVLKSQLDTLNSASKALQNEDLFQARKITYDSDSLNGLSASAEAGALTGEFTVSVFSKGTQTEMSSKNRVPDGLGAGLSTSTALKDLPLQTAITKGTYTISGKTLSIDNLDLTLAQVMVSINAVVNGVAGVNPESDGSGITFELDASSNRIIVDGGEMSSSSALSNVPILGSPTDTSNFLLSLKLLNRQTSTRHADLESGSGVSLWSSLTGTNSFLRQNDTDESLLASDSRIYVSDGTNLYRRIEKETQYDNTTAYSVDSKVYRNGFVYNMKGKGGDGLTAFPSANWSDSVPSITQDDALEEGGAFYKLLTSYASLTPSPLDFDGSNFDPDSTTTNAGAIAKGGVDEGGGNYNFFRAIVNRPVGNTVNWDSLAADYGAAGIASTATANALWNNLIPLKIRIGGRFYDTTATYTAVEHGGKDTDDGIYGTAAAYTGQKYVVGNDSDTTANANYYKPTTSQWDKVNKISGTGTLISHGGASADYNNWATDDYVQITHPVSSDVKFYKASSQWDPTNAANPAADELFTLDTSAAANSTDGLGKLWLDGAYIQDTQAASGNAEFYKAIGTGAWNNVGSHGGASDVQSWLKDTVVFNSGDSKYYQAKGNFSVIVDHGGAADTTLYETYNSSNVSNATKLPKMVVDDGSDTFYKAKGNWDETDEHNGGDPVDDFETTGNLLNKIYALRTDDKKTYEVQVDLTANANHDNKTNYSQYEVVKQTGTNNYYRALTNLADYTTSTSAVTVTEANNGSSKFVLDTSGINGKVYEGQAALGNIDAFDSTPSALYSPNDIVKDASLSPTAFYKASADWTAVGTAVVDHISGNAPTQNASGRIVRNSDDSAFYKSKGDFTSINNWTEQIYSVGATFANTFRDGSGSDYYQPSCEIKTTFTDSNAYTATDVIKDGGSYYQFQVAYEGIFSVSAAANAIVKGSDGNFYQDTSGVTNSTDPASGGSSGWSAGFASIDAMQAGLGNTVIKEFTSTDPATSLQVRSAMWNKVTDAVTLDDSSHSSFATYWEDASADVALGTSYWSITTDPQDVTNSAYWVEDTDATDPTANVGSNLFWEDVTSLANLSNVMGANTALIGNRIWKEVDSTTLTANVQWWEEIDDEDLANPDGSNTEFWTDVTTDLTGDTIFNFSNVGSAGTMANNYWSNASAELTDVRDGDFGNWWTDVDTDLTDLASTSTETSAFWTDVTAELTDDSDPNFSNHWTEFAHANSASDFDAAYWQQIKPGMERYNSDGSSGLVSGSIDYSIWGKLGNVRGYEGADGTFGTHDTGEGFDGTGLLDFGGWAGSATLGMVVKGSDNNYYECAVATTSNDPASGNESDWHSLGSSLANAKKHYYTDTDYWGQVTIGNFADTDYWEEVTETIIQSSQDLGTIDVTEVLGSANFKNSLTGLNGANQGVFFIGEGEGAVRIDYDADTDTVFNIIDRVNSSTANVHMYYDPVSDRFVVRNDEAGSVGLTLHESSSWDSLSASANEGRGNLLELMGLSAPADTSTYADYDTGGAVANGDFLFRTVGGETTYWQALQASPSEVPAITSSQWRQVIPGVGRAISDELGKNSQVKVNGGDLVYSNKTAFTEDEHGYEGISFDIANVSIGATGTFTVAKDSSRAKSAIDGFVTEFNDAQDYIKSLVSVTNDGENVTSGKFSSNIEISRLGSQLRKTVFGESIPHSESATTTDGANVIVSDDTKLTQLATDLKLGANDSGYTVKILEDSTNGNNVSYRAWDGTAWQASDAVYSSFRLSNIGLDFGIGSDRLQVKNSALLLQALEDEPDKVQALFDQASTTTFDANTQKTRAYEGVSQAVDDFITSFLSGDSGTGYKGAYNTHIESIRSQNKRLDERIEDYESYIEQREKTLSEGFMRMEEMQSKLNTQLQTLQNSFKQS
jgi:flagellar capping protein FliD